MLKRIITGTCLVLFLLIPSFLFMDTLFLPAMLALLSAIGVFEMLDTGLAEVPNPSQMLLEGRPEGASGTCVACVMEGTRPVLAEVQALVTKTTFNVPRRAADGFDFNRAVLLLAVAEKRAGMKLSMFDAYINVIGGLRLDEPGADLPVALAVASS